MGHYAPNCTKKLDIQFQISTLSGQNKNSFVWYQVKAHIQFNGLRALLKVLFKHDPLEVRHDLITSSHTIIGVISDLFTIIRLL